MFQHTIVTPCSRVCVSIFIHVSASYEYTHTMWISKMFSSVCTYPSLMCVLQPCLYPYLFHPPENVLMCACLHQDYSIHIKRIRVNNWMRSEIRKSDLKTRRCPISKSVETVPNHYKRVNHEVQSQKILKKHVRFQKKWKNDVRSQNNMVGNVQSQNKQGKRGKLLLWESLVRPLWRVAGSGAKAPPLATRPKRRVLEKISGQLEAWFQIFLTLGSIKQSNTHTRKEFWRRSQGN